MTQTGLWGTGAPSDAGRYAHRLLDIAVRRFKPVAVFGMFSGGHDSLVACHLAANHPATRDIFKVAHINTGIGIEQTREFVRTTARDFGWELLEYRAIDLGQDYDELVLERGFPGPFAHRKMYNRLKERGMRALVRDVKGKSSDRVLLVTGVRKAESVRRMGTVEPINREGARVWVAPIAWFGDAEKNTYIADHDLPRNEVVDLLHMSGECLCGAFAKPGELEWMEFCGFTEEVDRIKRLQVRAEAAGVPCRWGERPPKESDPTQIDAAGPLCVGCDNRR